MRETVAELWGFYVSEHLVWQEASREAAVLRQRCDELVELVDRVAQQPAWRARCEGGSPCRSAAGADAAEDAQRAAHVRPPTPISRHGAPLSFSRSCGSCRSSIGSSGAQMPSIMRRTTRDSRCMRKSSRST